jgi:hypothetical protein
MDTVSLHLTARSNSLFIYPWLRYIACRAGVRACRPERYSYQTRPCDAMLVPSVSI